MRRFFHFAKFVQLETVYMATVEEKIHKIAEQFGFAIQAFEYFDLIEVFLEICPVFCRI